MSLVQRKARPLSRDKATYRDDRLIIIACDDTYAPKQYFDFFRFPRVQVHVEETPDGSSAAKHVLDRLLAIERERDDELWMVLDVDHCARGQHVQGLAGAISEAKRQGVNLALSKPCFELWLLLHHQPESELGDLPDAKAVEAVLRAALGEYKKTNLKRMHYQAENAAEACRRAERLDQSVSGGDIPETNTTRVYKIWKSIVSKALPSQLPSELRKLRDSDDH